MVNNIVVIHVVTGTVKTKLAFDIVVNRTWKRHHLLLARLHAQRHTSTRCIAIRRIVNNRVCYCPNLRVKHYLLMPTIDDISVSIRKEALQVKKEYAPFSSIASVMPCKLLCYPTEMPM